MNAVELRCHGAGLATVMTEARSWLDHHQAQTSLFELASAEVGVVVLRLQFQDTRQASAFANAFSGEVLSERHG